MTGKKGRRKIPCVRKCHALLNIRCNVEACSTSLRLAKDTPDATSKAQTDWKPDVTSKACREQACSTCVSFRFFVLNKQFVLMFRLHRIARSSTAMFIDLPLACYLANATCAVTNIMTALIFIMLIASRSHAFFLVVPVRLSPSTCL